MIYNSKHLFNVFVIILYYVWLTYIQSNLASSNTDGSFTMANSNSFLSPYEVLPIAQENKYFAKFSYFILKFMLNVPIRIASSLNIQLFCIKTKKKIHKLSPFASCLGTIINPQWLELPMSRTHFHGPKDVRAIEVRLYIYIFTLYFRVCWSKLSSNHHKTFHFILCGKREVPECVCYVFDCILEMT